MCRSSGSWLWRNREPQDTAPGYVPACWSGDFFTCLVMQGPLVGIFRDDVGLVAEVYDSMLLDGGLVGVAWLVNPR